MLELSEASWAFKDWAVICQALGEGQQSIVFRKGGIAEGRKGFGFEHSHFFLFPTAYHQQMQQVDWPGRQFSWTEDEQCVRVDFWAHLESAHYIENWDQVTALQGFHIWRESVIRERFEGSDHRGVHLAFLRVYRLPRTWEFGREKKFGGCRSWIKLPNCPSQALEESVPVLSEQEHGRLRDALQDCLGSL